MDNELFNIKLNSEISSLYFAEDFIDSWYDHTNNLIVTTWFNLSTRIHYRQSYIAKLDAVRKYRPFALIVDTSKAYGVPHPEDQQWMVENILPEAGTLNIRFVVNVFPKNSIAKTGVKTMLNLGRKYNFNIIEVHSMSEAIHFINTKRASLGK